MKVGDLVKFSILSGTADEWCIGLLLNQTIEKNLFSGNFPIAHVLYKGEIRKMLLDSCQPVGE